MMHLSESSTGFSVHRVSAPPTSHSVLYSWIGEGVEGGRGRHLVNPKTNKYQVNSRTSCSSCSALLNQSMACVTGTSHLLKQDLKVWRLQILVLYISFTGHLLTTLLRVKDKEILLCVLYQLQRAFGMFPQTSCTLLVAKNFFATYFFFLGTSWVREKHTFLYFFSGGQYIVESSW